MKKFIAGLIVGLILATGVSVFAETTDMISVIFNRVKLVVNGNMTDTSTLLYNGSTYVQLRPAANAFGASLDWNGDTQTATLTSMTLTASVDNTNPSKNQTINLNVSGAGHAGEAYTAIVYYKTTNTPYSGNVGTPCPIKISSATTGQTVTIVVTLDTGEQTVTSFTPQ